MKTITTHIPDNYQPEKDCLKDRIILVTGAAGGIGSVASKTFARYGATVILMDKNTNALEKVYDAIQAAKGPLPAIFPIDFEGASVRDYQQVAESIDKTFGKLDGLLHNAARRDPLTPLVNIDLDDWFEILQVNLNAPFMLTQACMDLLFRGNTPSIVFTTDHIARAHHAYWGAYGISKHAIDGLMITLADEMENQASVFVNAIDPGPVGTPMRVRTYPGLNPGTMTRPEDIMKTYLYVMENADRNHGKLYLAQSLHQRKTP